MHAIRYFFRERKQNRIFSSTSKTHFACLIQLILIAVQGTHLNSKYDFCKYFFVDGSSSKFYETECLRLWNWICYRINYDAVFTRGSDINEFYISVYVLNHNSMNTRLKRLVEHDLTQSTSMKGLFDQLFHKNDWSQIDSVQNWSMKKPTLCDSTFISLAQYQWIWWY